MCESKVVFMKGNERVVVMEDVMRINVEGDHLKLFGLLGEYKELKGKIKQINLKDHEIIVEEVA